MDKIIITSLLVIAGVVAAVVLYNAVYPAIVESGDALTNKQRRIDERLQSQIEIVHAAPGGDIVGGGQEVFVWVKNVGSSRVASVESCDLFFGPEEAFLRIPYGTGDSHWTYELENATNWKPSATMRITIDYDDNLTDGERYYVKVVIPNGVSDEYYFSQ